MYEKLLKDNDSPSLFAAMEMLYDLDFEQLAVVSEWINMRMRRTLEQMKLEEEERVAQANKKNK